jgi:hypothetical protein
MVMLHNFMKHMMESCTNKGWRMQLE